MSQVKILITGDFCPINRIELKGDQVEDFNIYNDFQPYLLDNDLNITNLECPLYDENSPVDKIGPNLKSNKKSIQRLVDGRFNLVTLANNHIMDHDYDGLLSTITTCNENNIGYVGAGLDRKEAAKVFYSELKGVKLGVINIAENEFGMISENEFGGNSLDPVRNYYQIIEARKKVDTLILIVHGGHEYYQLPSPRMVDTYRYFIDIGVDIVVGHHTHCYSGYERYNEGLIFYSLGNFIFDWPNRKNNNWYFGYAIHFFIQKDKDIKFEIIPYSQNNLVLGLKLLQETERDLFFKKIQNLNEIIKDRSKLESEWLEMVKKYEKWYLSYLMPLNNNKVSALFSKFNIDPPYSKKNWLKLLNIIRCESHYDIFLSSLKNKIKK